MLSMVLRVPPGSAVRGSVMHRGSREGVCNCCGVMQQEAYCPVLLHTTMA